MHRYQIFILIFLYLVLQTGTFAQNPVIRDQFTADPSARVFNDKVYIFPSHDIPCTPERGRVGWFCMEDYHVFSSLDLTNWNDHGVLISQNKVIWVDSTSYSMWAPDCFYGKGKYYFYFPSRPKDTIYGKGFTVGVAISDNPEGPYIPQPGPIENVHGIDPNVFIDNDGQAYLYWSARKIFVARLKENMLELGSEPQVIGNLPKEGLLEGPFLFERKGIYYLTYPHVENSTEQIEYAIADNPHGPFQVKGVIMDELPSGCWTNQQSIIEFNNQWYLFYHNNDLSPAFDKNRSVCIDSLIFNVDGTIQKVIPTFRGVGLTEAYQKIQIDRYSKISKQGASIAFIDTLDTFEGWKTILELQNSWIQYNAVNFENRKYKSVHIKASSAMGGKLQIRLDKIDGPLLCEVNIPKDIEWSIIQKRLVKCEPGIHNLVLMLSENNPVKIDWIEFE